MGFFNYDKEGPGVDINAPKKRRIFQFFDLYIEKFSKLVFINLLFVACAAVCIGLYTLIYKLTSLSFVAMAAFIPILVPVCALSKLTKKIACDEPVFIFSDFLDAMKNNWKQGLLIGVMDYPFVLLFSLIFSFYFENFSSDIFFIICAAFTVILALYFCFMQIYLPLFAVSFELSFIDLIKNAAIFSVINLKSNFLVVIVGGIMAFLAALSFELVETPLYSGIAVLVLVITAFSLLSFIANFSAWPKVYELLVKPNIEPEELDEQYEDDN